MTQNKLIVGQLLTVNVNFELYFEQFLQKILALNQGNEKMKKHSCIKEFEIPKYS